MKVRLFMLSAVAFCLGVLSAFAAKEDPVAGDESEVVFDVVESVDSTYSMTPLNVFADIPLEVLDMIRPSSRLDMITYYEDADSLHAVPNAMGGSSCFLEVADDYLKVEVTPVSTLEIKILSFRKEKIAMTLYTVGGEGVSEDTEVRFFDASLSEMDADRLLKRPALKDFLRLKDSKVKLTEVEERLPFVAVLYAIGPGDAPLTAKLTSAAAMPQETEEWLRPLLVSELIAPWNGKAFKFRPGS